MTKKYKIYKRTVHEDGGVAVTFGTQEDVKNWKEEEQEWIEEDLSCDEDSIEELELSSTDPNIGNILKLINDGLAKAERRLTNNLSD